MGGRESYKGGCEKIPRVDVVEQRSDASGASRSSSMRLPVNRIPSKHEIRKRARTKNISPRFFIHCPNHQREAGL